MFFEAHCSPTYVSCLQIHQHIAKYLPSDRDVVNYSLINKKTFEVISTFVWRERYERTFDVVDNGLTTEQLAMAYKDRMRIATEKPVIFDLDLKLKYKHDSEARELQRQYYQVVGLELMKSLILGKCAFDFILPSKLTLLV